MIAPLRDLTIEPGSPQPGLRHVGELLPQVLDRYGIESRPVPDRASRASSASKPAETRRRVKRLDWDDSDHGRPTQRRQAQLPVS